MSVWLARRIRSACRPTVHSYTRSSTREYSSTGGVDPRTIWRINDKIVYDGPESKMPPAVAAEVAAHKKQMNKTVDELTDVLKHFKERI